MDEMLKHWEAIMSVGLIIASYAKGQADQKNTDRRVSKLENKQDSTDEKLSDLKADTQELKSMTKLILTQIQGK